MSGEINGADILLEANTGSVGSPTWTVLGSQRNASFEDTTDPIDTSSKLSRSATGIPGRYRSRVTAESLYVPGDTALAALQTAMRTGVTIQMRRKRAGTAEEKATCIITRLGTAAPDQQAVSVSAEFQVTGDWSAA